MNSRAGLSWMVLTTLVMVIIDVVLRSESLLGKLPTDLLQPSTALLAQSEVRTIDSSVRTQFRTEKRGPRRVRCLLLRSVSAG